MYTKNALGRGKENLMCTGSSKIRFSMRELLLFLIVFPLTTSIAHGGLFKESVEFADLSQLSEEGLQSLKDTEFEIFLAEAKRDLARLSRLVEEKVPSASKYSLAEWENKVRKIDEKHQKAVDKEKREALESEQLKAQYEKAAEGKVSL